MESRPNRLGSVTFDPYHSPIRHRKPRPDRGRFSPSLSLAFPPQAGVSGLRLVQPGGPRVASVEWRGTSVVRHGASPQPPSVVVRRPGTHILSSHPPGSREWTTIGPVTGGRYRSPIRRRKACPDRGWSSCSLSHAYQPSESRIPLEVQPVVIACRYRFTHWQWNISNNVAFRANRLSHSITHISR